MIYQNDLKEACENLEDDQNSLQEDFLKLKQNLESTCLIEDVEVNDVDKEREKAFTIVETLSTSLAEMDNNLKSIVKESNEASNQTENEVNNPVLKIVNLLNTHYQNLSWLEEESKKLQNEIDNITKSISFAKLN